MSVLIIPRAEILIEHLSAYRSIIMPDKYHAAFEMGEKKAIHFLSAT
jgi:hypothetical protein